MALCREIQTTIPYFNYNTRSLVPTYDRANTSLGIGLVRVDLLITVDAAAGPVSPDISRDIPPCVHRNLNYFQTKQSTILSRGWPNKAINSTLTRVENREVKASHADIDAATNKEALEAIRGCVGIEPDTDFQPAGAKWS